MRWVLQNNVYNRDSLVAIGNTLVEMGKAAFPVMPLAPTLLAALTPQEHDIQLVDMFYGDDLDYDAACDLVGITVRTPLALVAYDIADKFVARGKTVVLGGPHIFAFPQEAKQHASAVAIGEAEELWSVILNDVQAGSLRDYYVCGTHKKDSLEGSVYPQPKRPDLAKYHRCPYCLRNVYSLAST